MSLDLLALLPKGYTPVYFLIALIAGWGYAVQGLLVANYGRRFDPFLITACRGLSFAITLSPLLLLAAPGSFEKTIPFLGTLIFAGFLGAIAVALIFTAQRFFPVGVVASFQQMAQLWLLLFGFLFLGDAIGLSSLLAILVILVGLVALALHKSDALHLKSISPVCYGYVFLFPFLLGTGYFLLAKVSRQADPLVAAYIWEISIGVIGLLIFLMHKYFIQHENKKNTHKFTFRDAFFIGIFASGTLLGTGGVVILYALGNAGIGQTAVASLQMLIMAVIGAAFFGERLKTGQWLAIAVIIAGLVGLKLATG